MGKEVERLEHHPNVLANCLDVSDVIAQFNAIHDYLALLMLLQTIDCPNEGRLA